MGGGARPPAFAACRQRKAVRVVFLYPPAAVFDLIARRGGPTCMYYQRVHLACQCSKVTERISAGSLVDIDITIGGLGWLRIPFFTCYSLHRTVTVISLSL
ncbi:hypothetical protein PoB_004767500 [Plakobranchus ocellatus]|uniref:Uncharacterized protein n=1 Tax=Plakobranchus ocellatus TaxID=259542 RepID=A0AAV4BNX1_9GAST|nr:hypothetical protein PoB_004767500 [Plakobranchus ocellatus]